MSKEWSVEEARFLENNVGKMTYPMLSKSLKRTEDEIRLKIKELRKVKNMIGNYYSLSGSKRIDDIQGYSLKRNKEYKIIDTKVKHTKLLFKGKVVKNYNDHILFSNGQYQESFRKADLVGRYIKIEEAA